MQSSEVFMGTMPKTWKEGKARSIMFCVTEDCNLACKYCYLVGKNKKNVMSFDVAKRAVDFFLDDCKNLKDEAVIWEFIGGEAFLEIDLIDQICEYIKMQLFLKEHPWFENYMFNFSSNGLLYNTPKVQKFINKNKFHLSIGLSIDGNKIKHDLQRVYPDGSGSFDDVVKNVPLWQSQFPHAGTKATFAHEDLPYLKDSIICLWNMGIKSVSANVVFEDVWRDGDDIIYENQLKELADYVLERELWREYSVRFFDPSIGFPVSKESIKKNFCGTGKMIAIDTKGNLYPCVRFCDYSIGNGRGFKIGDIYAGIYEDKLRPFMALSLESQSSEECIRCEVASGCGWCSGCNYDISGAETVFQRATYICKMHKANVRANKYFWDKFSNVTGIISKRKLHEPITEYKTLKFLTSTDLDNDCFYKVSTTSYEYMDEDIFNRGIEYAQEQGFRSVVLGNSPHLSRNQKYKDLLEYSEAMQNVEQEYKIFINRNEIKTLFCIISEIENYAKKLRVLITDIEEWTEKDLDVYKGELEKLIPFIVTLYQNNMKIEINILTDLLYKKSNKACDSGVDSFTLAPNGKIYICPRFYLDNPENNIGTIEDGIDKNFLKRMDNVNTPICKQCDAYHCKICKYVNKKLTGEYNIPSRMKCMISHVERNSSMKLQKMLIDKNLFSFKNANIIDGIDYIDPLDKIITEKYTKF